MRLIDADELLSRFNKLEGSNNALNWMLSEVIPDMINKQPTAYNVDQVVEELELHSFEFGTDTLPAHYVRLNDAIEIARNGGVKNE